MQSFGAWYSLTNFNITSLYQILTSMPDLGPVLRKQGVLPKNIVFTLEMDTGLY